MLNGLLHQSRAGVVLILALLVSSFSPDVVAQTTSCRKPSVYYVNGVLTSYSGVEDTSREISSAINARFPEYGGVIVRPIHNPTEWLGDLAEVAIQQEWMRTFAGYVVGVVSVVSPLFVQYLQTELSSRDAAIRRQGAIGLIKTAILADIRRNAAPVILITHSEGNMFVNRAVFELKTDESTRDILGVQAVAVLGIGVADATSFRDLRYNSELYRYITGSDDIIIAPLVGVPTPNWYPSSPRRGDWTGHFVAESYLADNIFGNYYGPTSSTVSSARAMTIALFGEIYQNASRASPCLSLAINPSPAIVQQDVSFSVSARDRVTGQQISGAQVSLTANEQNQPTVICSLTTDQSGTGVCNHRFLAPARIVTVRARNAPSPTLPSFDSAPYSLEIGDGTFDFQVTDNPNGTFSSPMPTCRRARLAPGDGIIDYDACVVLKDSRIRCIGPGCAPGRFWVSMTASLLSTSSVCGFAPVGGCVDSTSTQVNWGVEPGSMVYVPGSLYHFNLPDGLWVKGWPSVSPLSPPQGFSRNFEVIQPLSPIYLYPGFVSGGSLDLTYSIFDTWAGTTYTRPNRVTVP